MQVVTMGSMPRPAGESQCHPSLPRSAKWSGPDSNHTAREKRSASCCIDCVACNAMLVLVVAGRERPRVSRHDSERVTSVVRLKERVS